MKVTAIKCRQVLIAFCVCILFAASCSRFCDGSGCWGPAASDCISCANYWRDGECVGECDIASGFYANATTKHCLPCSEQCVNTCTGPVSCFSAAVTVILLINFWGVFFVLQPLVVR